ncbi:SprT family zinc-dependent metalloprotease [Gaopeijia maritima]|uniref:SprT family zinc-dependent metalloprotease n=1 Tax=Gaopeijia maritima TaxID=3119007 RepID=A0ABU9E5R8_9BACT
MRPEGLAAEEILSRLHDLGAHRLRRVVLRRNRSTIWSLTSRRTVLNLHVAYRRAPDDVIAAFAVLARETGRRSAAYREARRRVARWPGLAPELRRIRSRARPQRPPSEGVGHCCATPAQRVYLQRLYRWLNHTRFDGMLPPMVPIRLSSRFSRRLGQLVPGMEGERRVVAEIALSADLMLEANARELVDTLVHEMAHAANYLMDGEVGHGPKWRAWARRAGCRDRATCSAPVRRRGSRKAVPKRVPALPEGWRDAAGGG